MYYKLTILLRESYSCNSYYYNLYRHRYADLLFFKGDHEECIRIYEEILSYLHQYINKEHIRVAHIYLKLAGIYFYKN